MNQMVSDIEKLVTPVLEAEGVELVDLTYQKEPVGWTLCFYLDKPNGITLDDCQNWSHRLGELLDQSNLVDRSYNLEVSSPGLYRPIKKLADFQKFSGERIKVKLYAAIDGQKNFTGLLRSANEETITLQNEEGKEVVLPRTQVSKCRLDPVIEV